VKAKAASSNIILRKQWVAAKRGSSRSPMIIGVSVAGVLGLLGLVGLAGWGLSGSPAASAPARPPVVAQAAPVQPAYVPPVPPPSGPLPRDSQAESKQDDYIRSLEQPIIEPSIKNSYVDKLNKDFVLLAKPARRDVEVLVYSGDHRWWRQPTIKAGTRTIDIYLGDDGSPSGEKFRVIAITTDEPLVELNFLEIPPHRTQSEELILYRR
jgi:hypothetical protein